ncbi:MAG: ATP-binding protein [Anaerolineales bacterium]|nr:ATP-binding protein [Anaerolineales bacterium]
MRAFLNSFQHILAELERIDLLVRIQVWRARQLHANDNEFSPYYISEGEIDALLEQTIGKPLWLDISLPAEMASTVQFNLDQAAKAIAERSAAASEQGIELRLERLVTCFDLNPLEKEILLLCLAPELDLRYLRLYAYLQDDLNQKHPTIDLVLSLLCEDIVEKATAQQYFAPEAALQRFNLLQFVTTPGYQQPPLLAQALKIDGRVRRFLLDDDTVDTELTTFLAQDEADSQPTAVANLPPAPSITKRVLNLIRQGAPQIFYFQGPPGTGKRRLVQKAAQDRQSILLTVRTRQILQLDDQLFAHTLHAIERELRLQNGLLYWPDFDLLLDNAHPEKLTLTIQFFKQTRCLIFLAGKQQWHPGAILGELAFTQVPFRSPTTEQRRQIWESYLNGVTTAVDLDKVVGQFNLNELQIQNTVVTAQNLARWRNPQNGQITTSDLLAASRAHSNHQLASLAQAVSPRYAWQDIVLPPAQVTQLQQMCDQMRFRAQVLDTWGFDQKMALGKGLNALFTGPPGTGKTMAADIMAGELELDLYKIDLSTVVSKYIGETEKNLARIFAEGETSNAILFFDEADALFGKRTEVKDAHDRYANLETSYLLQKMDEYPGMVILATNLRHNMDRAFVRRMQFIIEFPLPNSADRRRIWAGIWPQQAPLAADVDFERLAAEMDITGGHIRNIALAAAFLAAADGRSITMAHIMRAAEKEYKKMGKWLAGNSLNKQISAS